MLRLTTYRKSRLSLICAAISYAILSTSNASADELPLTLRVLNYQSFNGPDLQSYMVRTKEQIRSHWQPQGGPHTGSIYFQIFADGSLLQHSVEQSSGDKAFDQEMNSVIESCVPFGSPPPGSVRLLNIVATFGANPGETSGMPQSAPPTGEFPSGNPVNGGTAGDGASGAKARGPLIGGASETGVMEAQASSNQPPPRFLQGQVGEAGQYQNQPLQGQAMANAPPVFQSQMAMQAPLQGGSQQTILQGNADHGAMTIGVLGCEFGLQSGQIRQIMPGSDLLRYGVQPGDVIEAADGQPLRGKALQAYTRGTPGTYIQLTILHQGRVATFPVQRKDARMFTSFNGYFKKWAAQEKFW